MRFDQYQQETNRTAIYKNKISLESNHINYVVLGLCSEAGEVAGVLKKILRDDDGEITLESGYWRVFSYPREFVLIGKKGEFKEFKKKDQLIAYLSK